VECFLEKEKTGIKKRVKNHFEQKLPKTLRVFHFSKNTPHSDFRIPTSILMGYLYALLGAAIVVFTFADLLYTTLSTNGAGWLSGRVSRVVWKVFFWLSGRRGRHRVLSLAGMSITLVTLAVWIGLSWVGFALIFISDADAIRHGNTNAVATVWDRVYYTGYTLATLGNGDFYATTAFWKVFTSFVAFAGLSMVTIAITYLIQVVSAEIQKRQLALQIAVMGGTSAGILTESWNGTDFSQFESSANDLVPQILSHAQHHLAYPIIHYFHSPTLSESSSVSLAALDEAVTLLLVCVPPEHQPGHLVLHSVRSAVTAYLLTIEHKFIDAAEYTPPQPDLSKLREQGIPIRSDTTAIAAEYRRLEKRRRMLRAVVEFGGWSWSDLQKPRFDGRLEELH
jgi:hypothetical protein